MSEQIPAAVAMLMKQSELLDVNLKLTRTELNYPRSRERLAKWKAQTVLLIAQHLGPKEAKKFEVKQPGPSFTNDLLDELSDDQDVYRDFLEALARAIQKPGYVLEVEAGSTPA